MQASVADAGTAFKQQCLSVGSDCMGISGLGGRGGRGAIALVELVLLVIISAQLALHLSRWWCPTKHIHTAIQTLLLSCWPSFSALRRGLTIHADHRWPPGAPRCDNLHKLAARKDKLFWSLDISRQDYPNHSRTRRSISYNPFLSSAIEYLPVACRC